MCNAADDLNRCPSAFEAVLARWTSAGGDQIILHPGIQFTTRGTVGRNTLTIYHADAYEYRK